MGNSESKTTKKPTRTEDKINVRFPVKSELAEIEKAVEKINKDAKDGAVTVLSGFMRNASLERAREVNGAS